MDERYQLRSSFPNIRLVLPAFLAIGLFIFSIFFYIIPAFKSSIMERKKEMIQQLTNSAVSILNKYERERNENGYDKEKAKELAKKDIRYLRYGRENKDYFWIIDTGPSMIMHPYRSQLEGKDLSDEMDPNGKKLFVAMVRLCERDGQGFIHYMWQWKDDPNKVVPKLSYVKKFPQWNWIIGTGMYTEDVDREISGMIRSLLLVSIVIIFIISLILFYLMTNSLRIEKRRKVIEDKLVQSERKYRSLVEATTQGILIVHEDKIVYSNKFLRDFLGYSEDEFGSLDLRSLYGQDNELPGSEYKRVREELKKSFTIPYESSFIKKNGNVADVLLSISTISFGEDLGNAIVVNDISGDKRIKEELEESREQYRNLADNLKIGVFRSTLGKKGKIIEGNPATINILGFTSGEELLETVFSDLLISDEKWSGLNDQLRRSGYVKNETIEIRKPDQTTAVLNISLALVRDNRGNEKYCDGIIEDITERYRTEEDKDKLMVELKTAQFIFDEPLSDYYTEIIHCDLDTSVEEAVTLMSRSDQDIIFVKSNIPGDNPLNEYIGLVTGRDLRDRVLNDNLDKNMPVMKIMSSPISTISMNSSIFESLILMREKNIGHLAVTDYTGRIRGVIHRDLLFSIQNNSASLLISEIQKTNIVQDIFPMQKRVPSLVKVLSDSGANSKIICRKISTITDSILKKLINFAVRELGDPPLKFSFMTLGSEGREEQTLLTDQDNAIIYEDPKDEKEAVEAAKYFLKLGELVCTWMDKSGYTFCPGNIMAMNPKWNKPVSEWRKYFKNWITKSTPEDLLKVSIHFDFRPVHGEDVMTIELREFINSLISENLSFLQYISRNALLYKPPIGFFGNILLESGGEKPSTFNIKDSIQLIVNFARIYALKHNISETNTMKRLYQLNRSGELTDSSFREMEEVYDYLMRTRFRHQVEAIKNNTKPDNDINPKELTELEQHMLKYIFSQINNFQKKLSFDFTGSA